MITLTTAMNSALGRTISEPGVFVELGFATPVRVHDRQGAKSWNALTWSAADIIVSGLSVENGGLQKLNIAIVDSDNAIAQALRSEVVGKPVKVWLYDASALATADPVQIFEGVMGAPSGGDNRRVQIACTVPSKWLPVGMLAQLLPSYMFMQEGRAIAFGNGTVIAARRAEYA